VLHEVDNAALVLEGHILGLAGALIFENNFETAIQEGHCLQALKNCAGNKLCSFRREDGLIGPEGDRCSVLATACWRISSNCDFSFWFSTVFKLEFVTLSATIDFEFESGGQCVHDRHTHTVESAGHLVALATKLATGVQHRQYNFGCAFTFVGT